MTQASPRAAGPFVPTKRPGVSDPELLPSLDPSLASSLPLDAPPGVAPRFVRPVVLDEDIPHTTTFGARMANLLGVILPFLGVIVAGVLAWGVALDWRFLLLTAAMYLVTGLGITIGFHRYFTHKSFETSRPIKLLLGICGCMAMQGSILEWAAIHRRHHQYSDDPEDPHSPHTHGDTFLQVLRGLWHSHAGWITRTKPAGLGRYVRDLNRDPISNNVSRLFALWVALGLLIPAAIGGLITMSWYGVLLGFLWGGLVRIFLVHHVTWSVNSVCHVWGARPYECHDQSRNNPIFGVLALGEGWHNNHHAFPTSARHGLAWWQFDLSYAIIRAMSLLGLVWDVRLPSPERLASRRRD